MDFMKEWKPQSDSPTAVKECFKPLMPVEANEDFRLASLDIRAVFLQSKVLERDVIVRPPEDVKKPGMI